MARGERTSRALEASTTFVDTEVLVFAHQRRDDDRSALARALLEGLWSDAGGALSAQVLQEFYFVATARLDPPFAPGEAAALVTAYGQWRVVATDAVLIFEASELERDLEVSFRDALVVAAALRVGATTLVTGGLADGLEVPGLAVDNPFARLAGR